MIGLDISDRTARLIQLDDRTSDLEAVCWKNMPAGLVVRGEVQELNGLLQVIQQLLAECNLGRRKDTLVVSIPETRSFLRYVSFPEMSDQEVSEAVLWEVAQHVPFEIEDMYVDWQDVSSSRDGEKRDILVGAAQKKVVNAFYSVLSKLKLDIAAFELESQAIVRAVLSKQLESEGGLLIVDLGELATNVIVHDKGMLRYTATLRAGLDSVLSSWSEEAYRNFLNPNSEKSMDEAALQAIAPALDGLVREVVGVVNYYNSENKGSEVREVMLTGEGVVLPGIDQAFLTHFGEVNLQRANPWVNTASGSARRQPMDLQQSAYFVTAIGLALSPVMR